MAAYAPCSPQRKVIRNSQEYVKPALYPVKGSHSSICSGTIKATLFHKVKPRKACALGEVGEVRPAPSPCPPTGRRAAGGGGAHAQPPGSSSPLGLTFPLCSEQTLTTLRGPGRAWTGEWLCAAQSGHSTNDGGRRQAGAWCFPADKWSYRAG